MPDEMMEKIHEIGVAIMRIGYERRWSTRELAGALVLLLAFLSRREGVPAVNVHQMLDHAFELGASEDEGDMDQWP